MKREPVDMWAALHEGHPVCITTNGFVRADGACVMGRGNALEAKTRYPRLPYEVGYLLRTRGNHVYYMALYGMFTFPVKHKWNEEADLTLIRNSAWELLTYMNKMPSLNFPVYLPSPGTGNGRLTWANVEPILDAVFGNDPRLVVVVKPEAYASQVNARLGAPQRFSEYTLTLDDIHEL